MLLNKKINIIAEHYQIALDIINNVKTEEDKKKALKKACNIIYSDLGVHLYDLALDLMGNYSLDNYSKKTRKDKDLITKLCKTRELICKVDAILTSNLSKNTKEEEEILVNSDDNEWYSNENM
jgi:hypothetical protein